MSASPQFIGGPKDGSMVPHMLWPLEHIEMEQTLIDGRKIVYHYVVHEDCGDYNYQGQEG